MGKFEDQVVLVGETLSLRPLANEDFEALYEAASDKKTWEGHPAKARYKRDVFREYFEFLLNAGGVLVVTERNENRVIGCSRFYVSPDVPDHISIGFTFINYRYWGGSTNRELKRLMLNHAFDSFEEVWFHIDPNNIRSQKATAKLGAKRITERTLNLGGSPAEWRCWRLTKEDWKATSSQAQ